MNLFAKLALVGSASSMLRGRVLHDVLLAEDGEATNLAMKLPYRQGEGRIVEDGAVCPVMERMRELEAAASAV